MIVLPNGQIGQQWAGAYNIAPDVFLPKYSDGSWGYVSEYVSNVTNSAENVSLGGTMQLTTTTQYHILILHWNRI